MSLVAGNVAAGVRGFPRVSGDEPTPIVDPGRRRLFSPRERG